MPNFVGCLIGFQCWMAVSLTSSKCGKGKSIEAFDFAASLSLWHFGFKTCIVVEGQHFVVVEISAET